MLIERLSMTFTANGKNETFAVCLQLSVQYNQNILIEFNDYKKRRRKRFDIHLLTIMSYVFHLKMKSR